MNRFICIQVIAALSRYYIKRNNAITIANYVMTIRFILWGLLGDVDSETVK